jgi:hypothetical protein
MDTLALKITATPLLILGASLVSRRWGESVGGWLVGLPLTSGPVCFFLALDAGPDFAAAAASGSLAGAASEAGFCLAYGLVALRWGWPVALAAGSLGYAVCGAALIRVGLPLWALVPLACAALSAALWRMPRPPSRPLAPLRLPRWDIPARMAMATALVLALTALAPVVGPRISGVVATYPVFAAVLAGFSQRARGAGAALQLLRGLLTGLFAFTGFFAALALSLSAFGIAVGFAIAMAVALTIQAGSLIALRCA